MPIHTKEGVKIYAAGSEFLCSDGKIYKFRNFTLEGPDGIIAMRVKSRKIAEDKICEIYGGRINVRKHCA